MKKRIISMLLTVLMVMSLFSGLTVNAHAATYNGANTIEYTMAEGDFVLRICQRLGLHSYTCKQAIMILNNIQDGQWNQLTVGRTLILPASDYDALLISNGAGTSVYSSGAAATTATTSNVTGTATTGTATVVNTTAAAASADTLAYYLVPYTMSYGETVSGVCNALGVNFAIFSPFIKQVNNVSNWTKVRAGDTLIIPTPVAPAVGTTCYGVMEHIVASSDTAYGITASKGVNYNANERLLKVLNQTENLAAIKAGDKFFYPVPLTVSVPGTGNPGSTTTTTTTTTVTDGNGTTTTSTTTTAKLYKLSSGMATSDGTMLFFVDNQPVTAAPAGAKVTIVTDTQAGKAIQSLTVKHADGTADLLLSGDSFIMPSTDARVDAVIKTGHDINISANYSGKASASVGGVSVQSAVKGATVVIKSVDPNYEISSVYATYKKMISSSTKVQLTVSSSKAFIMPDADVDVEVVLKPVSTYAFYVNDPVRGSFYLEVNGSPVTRAAKGAQVTVVAKANEGYEPIKLEVYKHNDTSTSVNVFSNTFTMPGFDVDVKVTFGAKGNNILIMPSQFGNVYAFASDSPDISTDEKLAESAITEADTGSKVYLKLIDDSGDTPKELTSTDYNIDYDIVRNSDGLKVSYDKTNKYFVMPKGGVTVTPIITSVTISDIWARIYMNGTEIDDNTYADCSISVTWNGKTSEFTQTKQQISKLKAIKSKIPEGEYIDLRYDSTEGVAFVKYRITDGTNLLEEETNEANRNGYFKMPGKGINIEAYFETGKAAIGPAVIEGIGTVSYKVLDASGWKSVNTCEPGDEVLLVVTSGNGYKFDTSKVDSRLLVTRKDNGAAIALTDVGSAVPLDPNSYAYKFTMPASGVDIRAIFDPKPFTITMKCVDEAGHDLTGLGLWQIAIDWVPGIADNMTGASWSSFETKFDVAYGDYVTVAMTEAGWSKYDMVSFRIDSYEYTADELNYFYNFQMIEDRARDLTITAVLRPKQVGIHNLSAMFDVTKGGVEFLIIDSKSGYSDEYRKSGGSLKYVNKAVTGDTVAIVPTSISNMYDVKASDITITAFGTDADRIIPTEQWIYADGTPAVPGATGAVRVFTFVMPDSDVSVMVNFSGKQYALTISVYDEDNNVANGMVRVAAVSTTGAAINRDVATDVNFDDVAFNSTVSILRSELALAQQKVIKDVEISTASGKSVPYTDMSNAGEGITFQMPTESVWVIIRVADYNYGLPLNVVEHINGGKLLYRRSANTNEPNYSLSDFATGETVYVFDEPNSGYDHLGLGDLKILSNGVTNIANCVNPTETPHVWSFTKPEGVLVIEADFPIEEAVIREIKLKLVDAGGTELTDAEIEATLTGYTGTYKSGDTIKATEGQTISFAPGDGYKINLIQSESLKGISNTSYKVPADLEPDSDGIADTLTFTMIKKPKNETVTVTITTDNNVNISSSAVSGAVAKGTKEFILPAGETLTVTSAVSGLDKVTLTAGKGKVSGNKYTVPDQATDTLNIKISGASNPINLVTVTNGEVQFYKDSKDNPITGSVPVGTKVYINTKPNTGYSLAANKVKITKVVGGAAVSIQSDSKGSYFEMPEGGVNVEAKFTANAIQIPIKILSKSDIGKDITTAKALTETVKLTVNGTEITYKDGMNIDTKTAQTIVFPTGASSHKIDSVQVFKGTEVKKGTALTNTNYTVAGNEKYLVVFVNTGVSNTASSTSISSSSIVSFDSAMPENEGIDTENEGNIPDEAGITDETSVTDEADAADEVEIPDYPKIENESDSSDDTSADETEVTTPVEELSSTEGESEG
ncbi:MAG: hypothetical protein IJ649_00265 [Oscillospiraceae bacterium]|nr:hypothetical protein [Oscillospiraceae bacterium]